MVTGISADKFVELFPALYHMAESNTWSSMQIHGLLSTAAILDLFGIRGEQRTNLEGRNRPESTTIHHLEHGSATIRDQKPMSDSALKKALEDGLTPEDWYKILNQKVFFWVTKDRLDRLLSARAYRERRQTVLTVSTQKLLERHNADVLLSPINSGSTLFNPVPRGLRTFLPMDQYEFEFWKRRRSAKGAVVELAVTHSVPDIAALAIRVQHREGGEPDETIWEAED